jgi:hypothetical protein
MPALDTHTGDSLFYHRQGVLISGGNNRHRADNRADATPGAEILINKNSYHHLPPFLNVFVPFCI